MTIEEKAKDYSENNITCSQDILQVIKMGQKHDHDSFIAGAKWMIEKAVCWLQEHVNDYLFDDGTSGRPWLKCKSDMFDNFKKAMEE